MHAVRSNLITGEEVRARFGDISRATLGRWVRAGVLPQGVKIGRRRLYDVRELDAVVDAKKAERR